MSGAVWGAVADAALQVANTWMQSDSARRANQTNIKLQREQQAWEKMMSGSAVQRRRDDIEKAGGNPALAFTTGDGATTPNVTPAHVEPNYRGDIKTNFSAAAVADAQLKNIKADTVGKLADARRQTVEADIAEGTKAPRQDYEVNKYVEGYDQQDLKTKIMRNMDVSTAADAKAKRDTVDSLITMAKQQVESNQINLEGLRNFAKMGGIELGKATPIIRMILDMLTKGSGRDQPVNFKRP